MGGRPPSSPVLDNERGVEVMKQHTRNQERGEDSNSDRGRPDDDRRSLPSAYRAERDRGPFGLMTQLTREMDRMFEGLWRSPLGLLADRGGRGNGGGEFLDARWMP